MKIINSKRLSQLFSLNPIEQKIVTLAALGGMLEFYDFTIYGIFSIYFAEQFFPNANSPLITIIESYAVFILGYVSRPLGGIMFSHIGDEYGRKKVLIITVILMGLSSLGIGILPTYSQIGWGAPVILLILRLLQGLALGGELPSTFVYITESMSNKLGVAFGITMTGVNAGLLLGIFINNGITLLFDKHQIISFAWRIPFILGGALCLISYKIRKILKETSAFNKIVDKPKLPLIYLLKHHLHTYIIGTGLTACMSAFVILTIIFMPTYLHQILKLNTSLVSHLMLWVICANVSMIFITGIVANVVNPQRLFKTMLPTAIILVSISYYCLAFNHCLPLALIILGVIQGAAAGMVPLILSSLFPTNVRLTGVALSYNTGFTIFGAMAPIIVTGLIRNGFNNYSTPAIYLITMCLISLWAGLRIKS